jgi:hypothetical protein
MPNPIKYTTGTETLALKKGNFYIGTGDVGKGPSDVTGYYQGISPSEGGYVIYMNREEAPGDLSYHNAPTDSELITFTNNLAGQSYTTVNECLVYFAGQTDKMVLNRNYEGIVTDGLVLNLDAGFTTSYPRSGTTWYDVGGTNNGTLTNGPTFSGDSIVFDGVDDIVKTNYFGGSDENYTWDVWVKTTPSGSSYPLVRGRDGFGSGWSVLSIVSNTGIAVAVVTTSSGARQFTASSGIVPESNVWCNISGIWTSGSKVEVYVNGVLRGTTNTTTTGLRSSSDGWVLGSIRGDIFYNGDVAIAKIYNRALSADEVLQNYNATKGRFGL